jgi:hypothetical protein
VLREPVAGVVQTLINLGRRDEHLALAQERHLPDEEDFVRGITDHLGAFIRELYRPGHFLRAGNTKTYGLVRGELEVLDGLPANLRKGVFARPRTFQAWVRFAGPGPTAPADLRDGGILSAAIKLMGVKGRKLIDDERFTQDFLFLSAPTFTTPHVRANVDLQRRLLAGTPILYFLDPRDGHLLAGIMHGLWARAYRNPLEARYWSCGGAFLLGQGQAVQHGLAPCSSERTPYPRRWSPDYLRDAMAATLAEKDVSFDFTVQVQTDAHRMPIEDGSVRWPERLSPHVPVARLHIPAQASASPQRLAFADKLSFNPWHCLPAHRPLGNQNRARRTMYLELSKLRQAMNGTPRTEPTA